MSSSVPVLSLADYKNADDSIRASFLRKLGAAAEMLAFSTWRITALIKTEQEDIISLSKSFLP